MLLCSTSQPECMLSSLAVYFSFRMLRHKFFHRAKKIAITDRDLRRKELKKLKKKEEEDRKRRTEPKEEEDQKKEESESESQEDEEKEAAEKSNAEETAGEKSAVEGETSPKDKKKKVSQPQPVHHLCNPVTDPQTRDCRTSFSMNHLSFFFCVLMGTGSRVGRKNCHLTLDVPPPRSRRRVSRSGV